MPQKVQQKKKNMNIEIAIFTIILSIIPVIIIAFTGLSSFKTPYGIYSLVTFGICIYFSCIFAMFAWKNKALYIVMDTINFIVSLGLVIYAYINPSYKGGLLLHIAAALLFTFGIYQFGDTNQGNSFFDRYLVPIAIDIAGLLFILWFINVKMNVTAHIIIVSIINFFTLSIFIIPSLIKLFILGKSFFDDIENDEVEYEDETEEEIAARKEAKMATNASKKQHSSYEESRNKSQSNINGTARWYVYSKDIDYILKDLIHQYNNVIEKLNRDIRNNNQEIRNRFSVERVQSADKSNKDIKKCIKHLKQKLKCMQNNLEKLRKKEFTAQDKFKSFSYGLLSGKMDSQKSNNEFPTLRIKDCRVYYYYDTAFLSNCLAEIVFKGEDIYLKN